MSTDGALAALADPTRRQVFERVAAGARSVSDLADGLPVSRPAVSQHLKVLKEAGLVTAEKRGREHFYRLRPDGLVELRDWLDRFWSEPLTSYAAAVERAVGEEDS